MTRTVLLLALFLAGCGTLPAERSIRIDAPAPAAARPLADRNLSLRLLRFEARGALQERNLAYVEAETPTELRQAATIVWEEAPEVAAASFLSVALRQAGTNILEGNVAGLSGYSLSGTVQRFELVGSGGTGVATVALDLAVTDPKSATPWFNASYCTSARAADQRLTSVQNAFGAALGEIASKLATDLAARAAGGPAPIFTPRGSRLGSC